MPTEAVVPSYEDPIARFLNGLGEFQVHPGGGVFTLWEALVNFSDSQFPIKVCNREFPKQELISRAADIFSAGVFDRAERMVGRSGLQKVKDLCRQAGLATGF
ncbi:MAG: hypothetical protein ACREP9_08180 [Candidatus Dormibacteraceae bacterium]